MSAPKDDRTGIKRAIKALVKAGYSIEAVEYSDGESVNPTTVNDTVDEVMAVDDAFVIFNEGWVRFVMGNDPAEVVCDYTTNLEHIIGPLTESWW